VFVLWRTPAGSIPWVGAVIDSDKGVLVGDFVLDVPTNLHRSWHVNKEDWIRSAKATPDSVSPDFCDFFPERSLEVALYARSYALDLLEGTGWRIEERRELSKAS
jgi:hypothetical protein